MCQTAISLVSKALDQIDTAETLLKIKGVIALFIQTLDVRFRSIASSRLVCEKNKLKYVVGLGLLGINIRQFLTQVVREICRPFEAEIQ